MELKQSNKGLTITLKRWMGKVFWTLTNDIRPDHLLVLNYHGTQEKFLPNFRKHLEFYQKHFRFVSPGDLEMINNKAGKPSLMLTFDDGLRNNLNVLDLLDEFGVKALFLIVPNFVDSNSPDYFTENIRPVINPELDQYPVDMKPMTWAEIGLVKDRGHFIGSHSLTHLMHQEMTDNELSEEILTSKKTLIDHGFSCNPAFFCSPNNTLSVTSADAYELIANNYRFHCTTVCGRNDLEQIAGPHLYRINAEAFWHLDQVKWALSAMENKRWQSARDALKQTSI